ncbi:hypothetical protein QE152_g10177 [Popillia japonica]|uniref:Uncharacterized protein n=1 Tax=Popillia japonica TaxID=7064 RepID=A0AAW1LSI0_POPJA
MPQDNPADIISRGMYASKLADSNLWWHGPNFLHNTDINHIPYDIPMHTEIPEEKKSSTALIILQQDKGSIFNRYSSLSRLIRVIAYCIRFSNNASSRYRNINRRIYCGPLTLDEVNATKIRLIKIVLTEEFIADHSLSMK